MVAPPPTPRAGSGRGAGPGHWLGPAAVLIPVKAFSEAKVRLTPALPPGERAALARTMAAGVISAARPLPVAVVCDDREVAGWARSMDALVIWEPGRGLNGAVEAGIAQLADAGVERVVVAHADLPMAAGLAALAAGNGVVLVPDRSRDGTNVAVVPARVEFRFSYGPGSFARHLLEADRLGLPASVIDDPLLAFDVDWPDDLTTLAAHRRSGR
ncbi:MAG: hypothetical protein NVS3B12_20720 [Acidimicrobiales bacterium]